MTIFGQNDGTNHAPDTRLTFVTIFSHEASMEGRQDIISSLPPLTGLGETAEAVPPELWLSGLCSV